MQCDRLRSAIHQIDPIGAATRRRPPIRRRVYSVPCPNYVWHIDGNHKLIRWRMVLHHAVDGFSRLVLFGKCSSNNTAFQGGTAADVAWRGVNVQDLMTSQTLPHVNVPDTPNPLDDASFLQLQLQRVVDPLSPARGTDLYRRTIELVGRATQN